MNVYSNYNHLPQHYYLILPIIPLPFSCLTLPFSIVPLAIIKITKCVKFSTDNKLPMLSLTKVQRSCYLLSMLMILSQKNNEILLYMRQTIQLCKMFSYGGSDVHSFK